MKLNELRDDKNKRKKPIRVGRGIGSGKGKTCGRGGKGQTARSGVAINGFEGGQMPIYRRVPKRGFVNKFRVEQQIINVIDLQKFIDSKKIDVSKPVNKASLVAAGIIKCQESPLKVLGNGSIKSALNIEVDAASAGAVKAIEKAGGKVVLAKK